MLNLTKFSSTKRKKYEYSNMTSKQNNRKQKAYRRVVYERKQKATFLQRSSDNKGKGKKNLSIYKKGYSKNLG